MIRALEPQVVRAAERRVVAASPEDALMVRAARAVADAVERLWGSGATVVALVGGGDNGGDALMAAALLAEAGSAVRVALVSDHPHPRGLARVRGAGVDVRTLPLPPDEGVPAWMCADVWIDGITGTGLRGGLREPLASTVVALRAARTRWGTRVVAVDVPSGAVAADGTLAGPVLPADHTVTMGAHKTTLFLPPAALDCGTVEVVDLGCDTGTGADGSAPAQAPTGAEGGSPALEVTRPLAGDVGELLARPGTHDHKYTRGVLTVVAGSDTYPGAGVLAVLGALGAGGGMVRLDSAPTVERLVLEREPGVVTTGGRSQAVVLGSGLDAGVEPRALGAAHSALERGLPLVLDAGALRFVADLRRAHGPLTRVVLTPHAGEAAALLGDLTGTTVGRPEIEAHTLDAARRVVDLTGATLVLKGAVTLIASPRGVSSVAGETAWAGVAGSGDVLAGITGSLAAQRRAVEERGGAAVDPHALAVGAVWIHARAAAVAAGQGNAALHGPGHPIQAQDIARAVPGVIEAALEAHDLGLARQRRRTWGACDRGPTTGGRPPSSPGQLPPTGPPGSGTRVVRR